MRHPIDLARTIQPIRGGRYTFRTFADGYFAGSNIGERVTTLDRLVTLTMPAIDGENHKIVPHMEVNL